MCCKTIGKAFRLILLDLKTGVRRIWPAAQLWRHSIPHTGQ